MDVIAESARNFLPRSHWFDLADEASYRRWRDAKLERYPMRVEDIIVDCLTFPIATGQEETRRDGIETIEAIRRISRRRHLDAGEMRADDRVEARDEPPGREEVRQDVDDRKRDDVQVTGYEQREGSATVLHQAGRETAPVVIAADGLYSMYAGLKIGGVYWPIVTTSLVSMALLKALGGTDRNEINILQTAANTGDLRVND